MYLLGFVCYLCLLLVSSRLFVWFLAAVGAVAAHATQKPYQNAKFKLDSTNLLLLRLDEFLTNLLWWGNWSNTCTNEWACTQIFNLPCFVEREAPTSPNPYNGGELSNVYDGTFGWPETLLPFVSNHLHEDERRINKKVGVVVTRSNSVSTSGGAPSHKGCCRNKDYLI